MQEPPHNLEAEQAVLGAMFLEPEAVVRAANILNPEDFYRECHKVIFANMLALQDQGLAVDYVNLEARLSNLHLLESVGGLSYVFSLTKFVPTAAQIEQHAAIVKEESTKRQLALLGRTIVAATHGSEDATSQLEAAFTGLHPIFGAKKTLDFAPMNSMFDEYIEEISQKDPEATGYLGLATGFLELDELTNGLQKSDLILLAARPGMGKTAFVLNIIENLLLNSKHDYSIGLFSLEMSKKQLVARLTAILTGIDNKRLDGNKITPDEWALVWRARELLGNKKLYIDDTGGLTFAAIRSRARRLQLEKGLDLLVVDYLQLMASGKNQDRQQAIAAISRSLKALARELNIPIIALSQLSRAVETRQNKRPLLSDLRESGSLEQDADLVLFLYRDDYYYPQSPNKGITELIVSKHRNGPTGSFKLYFEKQHTKFVEML